MIVVPDRYGYEKVSERSEGIVIYQLHLSGFGSLIEEITALDDRIDECAEVIREYYKISELGDPGSSADVSSMPCHVPSDYLLNILARMKSPLLDE